MVGMALLLLYKVEKSACEDNFQAISIGSKFCCVGIALLQTKQGLMVVHTAKLALPE